MAAYIIATIIKIMNNAGVITLSETVLNKDINSLL